MSVFTRTGDQGRTRLGCDLNVAKSDNRIEVLGSLDEFNSLLGLSVNFVTAKEIKKILLKIQNLIFNVGAEIALGNTSQGVSLKKINQRHVIYLEKQINKINEALNKIDNFILPGGSCGGALLHLSRAVCRRVERNLNQEVIKIYLNESKIYPFINRLSDLLFVLARFENSTSGIKDIEWTKD